MTAPITADEVKRRLEPQWTPALVKDRLKKAAEVHRRLCRHVGPAGYQSWWPEMVRDTAEAYGYGEADAMPARPRGIEVDQMDEALEWLTWLQSREDQRLVWAWAHGLRWWQIAQRFRRSERTCQLWLTLSVNHIVDRLNSRATTSG